MSKIAQLRAQLRELTAELRRLGVTVPTYDEANIDKMTTSSLKSCIKWADHLALHHPKSFRVEANFI